MTLGALLLIASAVALVLLAAAMHQRLRALAATTDEAVAFAEWSFIFGGPAFAATLAVLILGTSTASVRLPRAINVTGLPPSWRAVVLAYAAPLLVAGFPMR